MGHGVDYDYRVFSGFQFPHCSQNRGQGAGVEDIEIERVRVGFSFLYLLRVKVGPSFGVHQRNPLSADLGQSLGKE